MTDRLEVLHRQIDDMTDADGEFAVVCPLSGKRPVPVRGKSFPTAEVAADAVDLVIEYRKLLREVDPHLENIPIVACEQRGESLSLSPSGNRTSDSSSFTGSPSRSRGRSAERPRDRGGEGGRDRGQGSEGESDRGQGETNNRNRTDDRDRQRASDRRDGRSRAGNSTVETVTLSGDGDDDWLRLTDAPVVSVRKDGEPLDDAVVGLELNSKL